MNKTRVLLATPLRDTATLPYMNGLIGLLTSHGSSWEFIPAIARATYINVARNDLVEHARRENCDEIVFWDADVELSVPSVIRLLSHPVDVVGAIYAKRVPGKAQWTVHASKGSSPDEHGLQEVNDIATGALRVKMSVFDRLKAAFSHRIYQHDGDPAPRCEYFPIGLCEPGGHRHPAEVRLDAVAARLRTTDAAGDVFASARELLSLIDSQAPLSHLIGEDIGFCRLCRAAGIKIYADTMCRVRHEGVIGFPAEELPI